MNKTKILWLLVIGCLVCNVILISNFYFRGPHFLARPEPKEIIIKKLGFSDEQQKQYNELIKWHRQEIQNEDQNMMLLKNQLYQQLLSNDTATKDSLIRLISEEQKNIENIHFKHFMDIKQLCTTEQIPKFESLANELADIFAKPKPHHDKE